MKRTLSMLLTLVLLLAPTSALAETNMFGWDVPDDPIEFSVFVFSDSWTLEEEQKVGIENMTNYLVENFNVKVDIVTTDGSARERANLMLAADDYPDTIMWTDTETRVKFVEQGKAVEMTPYLDTVATDIVPYLGNLYGMYLDNDEKLFYLPSTFGALMELPDYSAHLRYDEWQAIGAPEINTPDDYYNAVMEILEKFPTTPNGETRYSLSLYDSGGIGMVPGWLTGYWGLQKGWKIDEENNFTYWTHTDEGKAMTKYFNKFWNTGTMDPDTFVNKHEEWRTKFSNERLVGAIGGWWIGYNAGHEIWMLTDENWTEDKRTIQVGFKAPEAEAAYVTGKNRLGSTWTIITDKAKDPEGIMSWLNFQTTIPGMALLNWGIPNGVPSYKDPNVEVKLWNITSPDDWQFDETAKQQFITETWDYPAEGVAGANTGAFSMFVKYDRWPDGVHCVWGNQMWYEENKWKSMMIENMDGTIYDATAMAVVDKPMEVALAEQSVLDAWMQNWPLVVQTEDDDAFEAAWAALQSAVEMADLDVLTDFTEENYKSNIVKLGME